MSSHAEPAWGPLAPLWPDQLTAAPGDSRNKMFRCDACRRCGAVPGEHHRKLEKPHISLVVVTGLLL